MTDTLLPPSPATSPDAPPAGGASGEVRAKRRTYTAAEKLRILREADRCAKGELGALLRREGIYSSHLTHWRRERDQGLMARKRGPQVDAQARAVAALEREKAHLAAKLAKAELVIDAQKKLLQVLNLPEPEVPSAPL